MTKTIKRIPIKKLGSGERKQKHQPSGNVGGKFSGAIFVILLLAVAAYFLVPDLVGELSKTGAVSGITNLFKDKGPVAATVNGQEIYAQEVDTQYGQIPEAFRAGINKSILLDQIISQEVLVQEAEKLKLKVSNDEIDTFVNNAIIKSGWTQEKFEDVLKAQGMTLDELKQLYGVTLLIEKLLNKTVLDGIEVSDDLVKAEYDKNIENYVIADNMVSAQHILILVDNTTHTDEEALELIEDIRNKIVVDGMDFTELAKEFSEDPSVAANDGDLGYFTAATMVSEFSDAAFAMENVGDISEPVRTQFGYHLIKLTDRINAGDYMPFEDVDEQIRATLLSREQQDAVEEYIQTLRDQAEIKKFGEYGPKVEESAEVDSESEEVPAESMEDAIEDVDSEIEGVDSEAETLEEASEVIEEAMGEDSAETAAEA